MTTKTAFETLAVNAVDNDSRKVAHRATRPQLYALGAENLELARSEVEKLEAVHQSRLADYRNRVSRHSELQSKIIGLEIAADLDGVTNTTEIEATKNELDELGRAIESWSFIEPELSARIVKAKESFVKFEREAKQNELANLLDAERQAAIQIIADYETIVMRVSALQDTIDKKRVLQNELKCSFDGIEYAVLPKVTRTSATDWADRAISEAKRILLVG